MISISLLFVLVTLHELGHSFAALNYGVPVERLVLLPIGGVAQLRHMPDNPKQDFVIALAGPAVNVVLAILMGGAAVLFNLPLTNPLTSGISLTFGSIFSYIFYYNVVLALFNMIPAFPMDGGRVFRAALAMKLDYGRAICIAAGIGRVLAVLFGIYGLLDGQFFSVLIAIFIFSGATQEAQMVQFRQRLRGYTVQQAYSNQVPVLDPAGKTDPSETAKTATSAGRITPRFAGLNVPQIDNWCGDRDQGDVWQIKKPVKNDLHPTMKPVELVGRAIRNSSRPGDTVLDCSGGSGTTMIAAEKSGRLARLMELDPKYCDVGVRRWQEHSGKKATRESDGVVFGE